jgi:hypothetical protein
MKLGTAPIKNKRTEAIRLVGLLAALGLAVYWSFFRQAEVAPSASNSASPGSAVGPGGSMVLPSALQLSALEPVNDKPAAGRNPFRFGVPPPPPAPPLRPAPPPAPTIPTGPVTPPPPPPPPMIALKFTGVVQLPAGKKVAALSDGKGIFMGAEGDVIDGRFRIVKIGVESIVMEYLDGRGRQTIPLRGGGQP